MFSADEIKSYQKLYRERFGKDLSDEEAQTQANALVLMMKNIYKPMTQGELDEIKKRKLEIRNEKS